MINVAAGTQATDAVNLGQLTIVDDRVDILEATSRFVKVNSPDTALAALAGGADAIALGSNANASGNNSIALGAGSVASADDVVSVGNATSQRKIVNLAAGALVDGSTDAVNADQLFDQIALVRSDIPHLRRRILPTFRSPWRISPVSFRTSTRRLKVLGKGRGRPMAGLRRPWR